MFVSALNKIAHSQKRAKVQLFSHIYKGNRLKERFCLTNTPLVLLSRV